MKFDLEAPDVLWSEHPQEDYTCEYNGFTVGLGAHPAIVNQGIWNLVWLLTSAELLNAFLKKGVAGELSTATGLTPYILGTAWQPYNYNNLVATAASKLAPLDFIEEVKKGEFFQDLILTKHDPDWAEVCNEKALTFSSRHLDNVVAVNFGRN